MCEHNGESGTSQGSLSSIVTFPSEQYFKINKKAEVTHVYFNFVRQYFKRVVTQGRHV